MESAKMEAAKNRSLLVQGTGKMVARAEVSWMARSIPKQPNPVCRRPGYAREGTWRDLLMLVMIEQRYEPKRPVPETLVGPGGEVVQLLEHTNESESGSTVQRGIRMLGDHA